jgi:MSHA biogenesis protein MshG
MPLFAYKARNSRGDAVKGQIEAPSEDSVATQLINGGITPIEIHETIVQKHAFETLRRKFGAAKPSLDDLILFCRQMHTLSKAGVPLIRGISGLADTTRNARLANALDNMVLELEAGRELSIAMTLQGDLFSTLMTSMVRVGENTGKLDTAFLQLARYLELERDTRSRIKQAIRYPLFVLFAIGVAITIVNILVIPAFSDMFNSMKMTLPWQTRALVAVSDFTVAYWYYLLGLFLAALYSFRYYINTSHGKYKWDKAKLNLPIVGSIIRRALLSRFARSFAMASRSGVPLIQALTVVARAMDNDYVAEKILSMRNGVERGDSLTRTAVSTALFTPLVVQMLSVGEETGAVDDMLDEVADFYEREVDYELKNLSQAIEPILIISVGILVLILALGIFLPLWEIYALSRQ